jgi:hypothetical protein
MRSFAAHLIAHEAPMNESSQVATFPMTDKLRAHLAGLMGKGGYRALVSRALVLASAEVSWLRALRVKADGALEWSPAPPAELDPAELREGKVVLLAQLLGLLAAFIGVNLTLRVAGEIWPQISLDELDLGNGGDNEETK